VVAVRGDVGAAAANAHHWDPNQLAREAQERQRQEEERYRAAFSPSNRAAVAPLPPIGGGLSRPGTVMGGMISPTPGGPVQSPGAGGETRGVETAEGPGSPGGGGGGPPGGGGGPGMELDKVEGRERRDSTGSKDLLDMKYGPEDWNELYTEISCGCYPREHVFRGMMVWISEHVWFDRLSMFMIVSNCITLGGLL